MTEADEWDMIHIADLNNENVELRQRLSSKEDAQTASLLVIEEYEKQIAEVRAENERLKEGYQSACTTVAEMHRAAVGEITGPKRGIIEDVYDAVKQTRKEAAREIIHILKTCAMFESFEAEDKAIAFIVERLKLEG